jgi:transcriptional regulator with XRE-family HTH domain
MELAQARRKLFCADLSRPAAELPSLAELADIERTYPSLIERGLRQPTIGRVIAIAYALRIEPRKLVTMTVARLRRGES